MFDGVKMLVVDDVIVDILPDSAVDDLVLKFNVVLDYVVVKLDAVLDSLVEDVVTLSNENRRVIFVTRKEMSNILFILSYLHEL